MMRIIRCDRCGAEVTEEKPEGVGVFVARGPLPEGWRRVPFPEPDGSVWKRELCPTCVNALRMFLEGDGRVPGLLEAEALAAVVLERGYVESVVLGKCPDCEHPAHPAGDCVEHCFCLAGCLCPKPQEPTPPCPIHGPAPEAEPEPEHDTPECPFCPSRGFQYTAMHIRELHPERWEEFCDLNDPRPVTEHTHDFVGDEDECTWPGCIITYSEYKAAEKDPRPNLTARAEKLASGRIAVGSMTAPCPEGDGRCSGLYERGKLPEHMKRYHG